MNHHHVRRSAGSVRTVKQWSPVVLAVFAAIPVFVACGSKTTAPIAPVATNGNGPPGYPGDPGPQAATTPTVAVTAPTATATATATDASGNPVTALITALASAAPGALDPIEAGLKQQAAVRAPGMQPEGALFKATLTEGQHSALMVPMQAGKCYTVLGFSPTGNVVNLDLALMVPPLYTSIMTDGSYNNVPALAAGANATCPLIPLAVPYKVDVSAKKGSGIVGVQVYSKTK